MTMTSTYQTIEWTGTHLNIIDQTQLPEREEYLELTDAKQVWEAINRMNVRGAPAIGITGAYGLYLGIRNSEADQFEDLFEEAAGISDYLNSARPTAVNLSWALKRIMATIYDLKARPADEIKQKVLETAVSIHDEDRSFAGLSVRTALKSSLTGKNIDPLQYRRMATGEFGTAFSVILHAHQTGKLKTVWVDETRPLLQGSRLTAWELKKADIPFTLNIDSAAAALMQQKQVDMVIAGADRISRNGDTANKIGPTPWPFWPAPIKFHSISLPPILPSIWIWQREMRSK
jgi:methylthioribose-1-phosphate isomerase